MDQNTNSQRGIFKSLWPHASGISAMRSIEAFSLGNELVHVQAVPRSSIDSLVVTPRHDNVKWEKPHRIFSGELRRDKEIWM